MKTKIILIVVCLVVVAGFGVWFLSGGQETGDLTQSDRENGSLLSGILGKVGDIESFSYELVVDAAGQISTQKVWLKGNKMRSETEMQGQKAVYLVDSGQGTAYMYMPAQNTAMKIEFNQAQEAVGESPLEQSGSLETYNPTVIGEESVDGKDCLVIEYETGATKMKMWIWKEYGFPIKTETVLEGEKYTTQMKEINFGNVNDEVFKLPSGVQIMELPAF